MASRSRSKAVASVAAEPVPAPKVAAKKAAPTAASSRAKKQAVVAAPADEVESEESASSSEEEEVDEEEEVEEAPVKGKKKAAAVNKKVAQAAPLAASVPALHVQLGSILSAAQHSYHTHAQLSTQAMTLLQGEPSVFFTSFSAHTAYLASKGKKEATTQRVVEWVGAFIASAFNSSHNSVSTFAERFLASLLDWCSSKDKSTRWRSVQLIGEIMRNMAEECDLPEWIFDAAVQSLIERCEDKIEAVRIAAAGALHRFQSGEEKDPVTLMYVKMMSFDLSSQVRKAAIEHAAAAASPRAIAALLARAQDCEAGVRAAAFKAVQSKLHMKQLSIEDRVRLVRLGLKDRHADVVKAAGSLVEAWLSTKDKDIVRLLKSLAVETFTDECGLVVNHLVKFQWHHSNAQGFMQPPYNAQQITPERALYWKVLTETLKNQAESSAADEAKQAELDSVLPDTIELCTLLAAHSQDAFITAQLLSIFASGMDLADEAGRRELNTHIESLLKSPATNQSLVPALMKVYRLIHPDENDFIRVVLELLSDIHNPLDADDEDLTHKRETLEQNYAQLNTTMSQLKVQKQAMINAENFAAADVIKNQLSVLAEQVTAVEKELNSAGFQDDGTWARLLSIVCDLLENIHRFKLNHPGLLGLRESLIEPGIQHDHLLIQSLGLKALSLYALLDRTTAMASLPMFLYAASNADTLAQQATAMRAVTDLLMMFEDLLDDGAADADVVPAEAEEQSSHTRVKLEEVQALFTRHMTTAFEAGMSPEMTEVCVMAVECFAKLLLFDRLPCQPAMLSAMLFIFFHPSTDTRITQCLAVFLPGFLTVRKAHLITFFQSVLPTIRLLSSAVSAAAVEQEEEENKNNVSGEINVWKGFELVRAGKALLSFLAPFNTATRVGPNQLSVNQALSLEICAQLLASPTAAENATLVSMLASMDLVSAAPSSASAAAAVSPLTYSMRLTHALGALSTMIRDKVASKELTKFAGVWNKAHEDEEVTPALLEQADEEIMSRVAEMRLQQIEESEVMGVSSADAESAPAAKKKSAAAKGKRALRPKTPAKSKRKAAKADSSDSGSDVDAESVSEDEDEEEDEEQEEEDQENFQIKKSTATTKSIASKISEKVLQSSIATLNAAPSRPARGAKVAASKSMAESRKKLTEMDRMLDDEEEQQNADSDEEQENIRV